MGVQLGSVWERAEDKAVMTVTRFCPDTGLVALSGHLPDPEKTVHVTVYAANLLGEDPTLGSWTRISLSNPRRRRPHMEASQVIDVRP